MSRPLWRLFDARKRRNGQLGAYPLTATVSDLQVPKREQPMSETAPEPAAPVDPAAPPAPAQPAEMAPEQQPQEPATPEPTFNATQWAALFGQEDPEKVKKQLDHARTWEKRAKDNAEGAQKYAEWQESQKTEQQRLADAKAASDRELSDLRSQNARLMAAATHNLPPDLIDLLGSGTEEEIDARAKLLAERLAAAAPPPAPAPQPAPAGPAPTRPVESLTPGAAPVNRPPEDMDAVLRAMAGRT